MLVVETIARIRRAHVVQGKAIKAVCRELRVSRKVVRKVLRSEATEFHYEREQQPMPRLGAWRDELDKLLAASEARPSRERLTLIRLFEALRGSGYEGGYDAVRRYARTWRRDQVSASAAAYVPLSQRAHQDRRSGCLRARRNPVVRWCTGRPGLRAQRRSPCPTTSDPPA